jgi:hypothetical protein
MCLGNFRREKFFVEASVCQKMVISGTIPDSIKKLWGDLLHVMPFCPDWFSLIDISGG